MVFFLRFYIFAVLVDTISDRSLPLRVVSWVVGSLEASPAVIKSCLVSVPSIYSSLVSLYTPESDSWISGIELRKKNKETPEISATYV